MRYKYYLRRTIPSGEIQRLPFDAAHYKIAGVPFAQMGGMPVLEAFQLVNHLNVNQTSQTYVYGLE